MAKAYNFSGIYLITNAINGKVYVGSAIDVASRISCHKSLFKSGTHHNKHLRSAVQEYGIKNFTFELWEKCAEKNLHDRESYWIQAFDAVNRECGYNVTACTTCSGRGRIAPVKKFVDNDGNEYATSTNVSEFARAHGLNCISLRAVASGRLYSVNGWRLATPETIGVKYQHPQKDRPKSEEHKNKLSESRRKTYKFISPKGEVVSVNNLIEFCEINMLDHSCMNRLANGGSSSHKSWRAFSPKYIGQIYDSKADLKTKRIIAYGRECKLLNPQNEIVKFKGIKQFARENDLLYGELSLLINGKLEQYKGYKRI